MANLFTGSEIVEVGIQIEKNGRDFYNTLVKRSKSPDAQKIFKFLAGEEEKHIIVFQKILSRIEEDKQTESYKGEYFEYMNALASDHIFTKKDTGALAAKNIKNDEEAVEKGIGFEKDSIIFYEGMKKVVPEPNHKTIDELIEQEQSHLRQLSDLKKKLVL